MASALRKFCGVRMLQAVRSCNSPWAMTGRSTNQAVMSVFPSRMQKEKLLCTSNSVATAQHADHNHSRIWTTERFLSASLLGLIPVAFVYPNSVFDYAAALAITTHVHWGVEAIVVDYIRPNVVGPTLARIAMAGVYFLSIFTLGGLFYFNYSDVGLMQAIRMLWKL